MNSMLAKIKKIVENFRRLYDKRIIKLQFQSIQQTEENNTYNGGKNIAFIIPHVIKFSGGHTSIFRLGTELVNNGYEVTYISLSSQSKKCLEKNAITDLSDYKGKLIPAYQYKAIPDIVIATSSDTVYYALSFKNGYKMYFIQDYEPYFFNMGDRYLMTKLTYEAGLHMVCLGSWIQKKILENSNDKDMKISYIDFPVEKKEYKFKDRNFEEYREKKTLKLAVYIKNAGRRIPLIVQCLVGGLIQKFNSMGINLKVYYFGDEKKIKFDNGINLGKLSKDELNKLYSNVDFGMVMSLTNISLVPYEMIATGLPIIELKNGSFLDFFDDESAVLTDLNVDNLFYDLKDKIQNPEKIKKMTKHAYYKLDEISWQKSGQQLVSIIEGLV